MLASSEIEGQRIYILYTMYPRVDNMEKRKQNERFFGGMRLTAARTHRRSDIKTIESNNHVGSRAFMGIHRVVMRSLILAYTA